MSNLRKGAIGSTLLTLSVFVLGQPTDTNIMVAMGFGFMLTIIGFGK